MPIQDSDRRKGELRRISAMEYVGKSMTLNVFEHAHPIHRWYVKSTDTEIAWSSILPNAFKTRLTPDMGLEDFIVGMPFWGCHLEHARAEYGGCSTCFLAIGINMTAASQNTYILHGTQRHIFHRANQCNHDDPDLQSGIQCRSWRAQAFLAGWSQSMSSLGTVTAISPHASRIAAANWDRVLVWTFNPAQLHHSSSGTSQNYFPARDYNSNKRIGRLRPVQLPTQGVVYRMLWTSESVLFATTEHGLVQWDMGSTCTGKQENLSLDSGVCSGAKPNRI